MGEEYVPTFEQEELHDLYDIVTQKPTRDVLEVLSTEDKLEIDEFYDQLLDRGYDEPDVNHLFLTHQGRFITTSTDADGRYFEPTPLGEAAIIAEDRDEYVEYVQNADRVAQDREYSQ